MKTTTSLTPYQQIEIMVENGICIAIDISYETSKFIITLSKTSAFNRSFEGEYLSETLEKAYGFFVDFHPELIR